MAKIRNYFRIGEVARLVGVSPSSLRNWEKVGLFKAVRSEGGYRLYSRDTIADLKKIQSLRKTTRVNIPGIQYQMQRGAEAMPLLSPENLLPELPAMLAGLRRKKNLTLSEVSREIGMPASFLNAVERGKAMPFAVLPKLAKVYKTSVLSFFNVEGEHRKLVRRKDRRVLRSSPTVQMELVAFGATLMEPHVIRIAPRTGSGGSYRHEGEELLYMLEGKLELWLDEIERYVLEPGDTLYFKSTQAHRWQNLMNRECVVLWINAPLTF
jgi:DNA-binding transcriptional MerR regulator/mannose-6-phosphate isomerase-like protein (cupin superfamily)